MMKQLFLFICLSLLSFGTMASNADLFAIDKEEVSAQLAEMNELEQYVMQHEGATISEIRANDPMLVADMNLNENIQLGLSANSYMEPLGIPAFVWGFCFNVGGLAVVYFVTEDDEETKKALYGCVTSALLWGVTWVITIVAGAS